MRPLGLLDLGRCSLRLPRLVPRWLRSIPGSRRRWGVGRAPRGRPQRLHRWVRSPGAAGLRGRRRWLVVAHLASFLVALRGSLLAVLLALLRGVAPVLVLLVMAFSLLLPLVALVASPLIPRSPTISSLALRVIALATSSPAVKTLLFASSIGRMATSQWIVKTVSNLPRSFTRVSAFLVVLSVPLIGRFL